MRKIIIDCDPGVDDASALFLGLAARRELDIVGVTTVAGNVGPALTARNACWVRELAKRDEVPVYAGCARPLVRPPLDARDVHGASGLGGLPVGVPAKGVEPQHAVAWLVETFRKAAPCSITLVITGPATNMAAALAMAPEITAALDEIVVMGGASREGGNITPSAEFNVYVDPHAAAAVFACGVPITIFSLDVTHQVRTTADIVTRFRASGARIPALMADLFAFSNTIKHDVLDAPGAPLHDPCTIAYLLEPSLFTLKPCSVAVETASAIAMGHTAVDFRARQGQAMPIKWAVQADAERFFAMLLARVSAL
ncbi:MAG TPA: nucleoside hydrolase [Alphaproteobacteria bacterium]|nr:nucleoside hydrolase [Alphaproteobacteria bacterium]HAJ46112.1 nucleoside hydrolase [Alphaproteobacteria bacterium]